MTEKLRRDDMIVKTKYAKDYNLVHRYLCGDRDAGQELYASIYPLVQQFIWNHTNAKTLTESVKEEILSQTMMTSVEKLEYYNGTSSFSTYVCGIAKFKILEKIKSSIKESEKENNIINIEENTSIFDNPLNIIIDKELRETVAKAQQMLSRDHQQVIQLRLNGMTAKQIAEMVGMSEDAVNSMFYRAIKAFKKNFENIYYK